MTQTANSLDDELKAFNEAENLRRKREAELKIAQVKASAARVAAASATAKLFLTVWTEFEEELRGGNLRVKFERLMALLKQLSELDHKYVSKFTESENPYHIEEPKSDKIRFLVSTLFGSGVLVPDAGFVPVLRKILESTAITGSPFFGKK